MKPIIAILFFLLISVNKILACSCADKPSIKDNWQYADEVFIGKVERVDTSHFVAYGRKIALITIRIEETFKQKIFKNYNIRTFTAGNNSCDNYFEPRKKYLIYASSSSCNGFLKSSICSRTNLFEDITSKEIDQLRSLYKGQKSSQDSNELILDNREDDYELNLLKASNNKLKSDYQSLIIFSVIITSILLVIIIYLLKRKHESSLK